MTESSSRAPPFGVAMKLSITDSADEWVNIELIFLDCYCLEHDSTLDVVSPRLRMSQPKPTKFVTA